MGQRMAESGEDEDDTWDGKLVLSLDGGGIRGYASLLILQQLMSEVVKKETECDAKTTSSSDSPYVEADDSSRSSYLPCHYFDYIGGTSTGGIIAILLGRLRASVQTTMEIYERVWLDAIRKRQYRFRWLRVREINYEERAIKKMGLPEPGKPSWNESSVEFISDSFRCKTIICALRMERNESVRTPYLFRSYHHAKSRDPLERHSGQDETFQILDVIRATSAAPAYFEDKKVTFYDPGFILGNPSWEIYKEVNQMHHSREHAVKLFVSLGVKERRASKGRSRKNGMNTGSTTIVRNLRQLNDLTETMEAQIDLVSKQYPKFSYYRMSLDVDDHNIDLEEWRHSVLKQIEAAITATAKDRQSLYRECAEALVTMRRKRAQTSQWESFALGTRYRCPEPVCPSVKGGKGPLFQDRNELLEHLQICHDCLPPNPTNHEKISRLLDAGRTNLRKKID